MGLEIHRIGESNWPRYCLAAVSSEGTRFWDGAAFGSNINKARLYAFLPEVCREFERLQEQRFSNPSREQSAQEFEARITVKLHSDQPLSERELARFLDRVAELFLPTEGPMDNSWIQAEIHWHELKEREDANSTKNSTEETLE